MTESRIVDRDTLDAEIPWDTAFRIEPGGIFTAPLGGIYEPEVYLDCDEEGSVIESGDSLRVRLARAGWEPVGVSGQQGGGFVMHASEYVGGGLADDILDTPGVYVLTEVRGLYPDEVDEDAAAELDASPIGWVILRQLAGDEGSPASPAAGA